jgi:hypothetical protein
MNSTRAKNSGITEISLHPGNEYICTSAYGHFTFINTHNLRAFFRFEQTDCYIARFSKTGRYLVISGKTLSIWDLAPKFRRKCRFAAPWLRNIDKFEFSVGDEFFAFIYNNQIFIISLSLGSFAIRTPSKALLDDFKYGNRTSTVLLAF